MADFYLTDLIPVSLLQRLQDAFSNYVGMAALTTDQNGIPVTEGSGFSRFCMELTRKSEKGCEKCEACDRDGAIITLRSGKPAVYQCHAGLVDYAAPIMLEGKFIGSFIGGQVRMEPVDEAAMRQRAEEYGIDPEEYIAAAQETNEIPKEQIERTAQFLSDIAEILSSIAYEKYEALEESRRREAAAQNRSSFMAQFSEDLHTTMSDISALMERTGASKKSVRMRAEIEQLMQRTRDLENMADSTAEYMSVVDDTFEIRESVYDIRRVIEVELLPYESVAEDNRDRLIVNIDESVPAGLYGDPKRIGHIIGRLIRHAISYTADGEIALHLYCRRVSYATVLMIAVSDSGMGMKPDILERAREALRAERTIKADYQDFAMLDFSLVGHLVRLMYGKVSLTSEEGKGTTFMIEIPQLTA